MYKQKTVTYLVDFCADICSLSTMLTSTPSMAIGIITFTSTYHGKHFVHLNNILLDKFNIRHLMHNTIITSTGLHIMVPVRNGIT